DRRGRRPDQVACSQEREDRRIERERDRFGSLPQAERPGPVGEPDQAVEPERTVSSLPPMLRRTPEPGPIERHQGPREVEDQTIVDVAGEESCDVIDRRLRPRDRRERELRKSLLPRLDEPPSHEGERNGFEIVGHADDFRAGGERLPLQRETQPRAVQREEVSAYGVFPIDLVLRVEAVLRRERRRQPQLDRVFVARRGEPFRAELRQGTEPFLGRELRAAGELRLRPPQRDQEIPPPLRVRSVPAAGEDRFLAHPRGASDRSRAFVARRGAPQRFDPIGYLVDQVLVWLGADGPTAEGNGKIGLTVALDVAVTLESRDPPRDAEARDRASEIARAPRAPTTDLAAAFRDQATKLLQRRRPLPQREPLLAPILLALRGAAVSDRR